MNTGARNTRGKLLAIGFAASTLLCGCVTVQLDHAHPEQTLAALCGIGAEIHEVKGRVWMKVNSREASGQFPASALAHDVGGIASLEVEVTNPLGGTEAKLSVDGGKYEIKVPGKDGIEKPVEQGRGVWGGIPLRWATRLFLGRVPCPSLPLDPKARVQFSDADLIVETPARTGQDPERFTFKVRERGGYVWADQLHWERLSPPTRLSVDFKFDDPDLTTRSPLKWEAKSDRGEVKVWWKDFQSN